MSELQNNEVMEAVETTEIVEDVIEKSGTGFGKIIGIAGGVALIGYGAYKLVKFIKNKKANKNIDEADVEDISEEDFE